MFLQIGLVFVTRHVQTAIEKEHTMIVACMKILYFMINNELSIIRLKDNINFLRF